jgi:hypothetical protein
MEEYRTLVRITPSSYKITLRDQFLTIGSCFSDAIGARLLSNKFSGSVNPFGTIYNPVSMHRILISSAQNSSPSAGSYCKNDDVHFNYHVHSSFADFERTQLERKISDEIARVHSHLKKSRWLLITYGTAWVYTLKESGEIVANCHKQPSGLFDKSLLTVNEVVRSFDEMYKELRAFGSSAKILLTVSPVRHIRDTLPLNAVSKSVLRIACHALAEKYPDVEYFPAYEIIMDDLRDYRFYKSDMIHPTEQAEDYIWKKFTETYMDKTTSEFIQQWQSVSLALRHRPFHPQSARHQIFLRQTLHKLEELKDMADVDAEIRLVQAQLLDSANPK